MVSLSFAVARRMPTWCVSQFTRCSESTASRAPAAQLQCADDAFVQQFADEHLSCAAHSRSSTRWIEAISTSSAHSESFLNRFIASGSSRAVKPVEPRCRRPNGAFEALSTTYYYGVQSHKLTLDELTDLYERFRLEPPGEKASPEITHAHVQLLARVAALTDALRGAESNGPARLAMRVTLNDLAVIADQFRDEQIRASCACENHSQSCGGARRSVRREEMLRPARGTAGAND